MVDNRTRLSAEEQRDQLVAHLGARALSDLPAGTILVVPSLSFPLSELRKIIGIQYYEERMLFMTLLLRNPDLEIVFVTSARVDPAIVDYYLSFLPDPVATRARLHMVTIDDPKPDPLVVKLLGRVEVIEELRSYLTEPALALSFNVTEAEWLLSEQLGVVLYGPHPDLVWFGSKSGSRRIAHKAGIPVLPGAEDLTSTEDVERAIRTLAATDSGSAVIKLNNGFSGQGNAIVPYSDLGEKLVESPTVFCATEESWATYGPKIVAEGAIVEQQLIGPEVVSPSVQMRIGADGFVEVISTHDQILGGPDGQVYLGCTFPARRAYREMIQRYGRQVARVLADKGVVGSFGVDFVIDLGKEPAEVFMSEINLRMGGTSHPFYMARFATQGLYDETSGHLIAGGRPKFYVATDNLKLPTREGLTPARVIERLHDEGLTYDHASKTGVTLHLLGALEDHGKLGCVSIGDSRAEAESMYGELRSLLGALE